MSQKIHHRSFAIDFRGAEFANHPKDLKGNNDLLTLTKPDVVKAVHTSYLRSGANLVETKHVLVDDDCAKPTTSSSTSRIDSTLKRPSCCARQSTTFSQQNKAVAVT
jgi:S-methylmethionine-dependent homocysteine/selenocysteine methylase